MPSFSLLSSQVHPIPSYPFPVSKRPAIAHLSTTRACIFTSAHTSSTPRMTRATTNIDFTTSEDTRKRIAYLCKKTRIEFEKTTGAVEKLMMIDTIQRLGLDYYMVNEINSILRNFSTTVNGEEEDLFAASLRFRLLRHNGHPVSSDVFKKFMDEKGNLKKSLAEDTKGLLSLYEASFMGTKYETTLSEASKYITNHRRIMSSKPMSRELNNGTELIPRHHRMARLETRRFIEQYSTQDGHNPTLSEFARLDYNKVQAQHRAEITEITRWWKQLGLVEKLGFARDRPLECFLWAVGLLPEPKYSGCRIEIAKTIAILLVIDDIFDTYGEMEDLILFTRAIRRWDLEAMEGLPHYMKICYMALYNTTNEICFKILKDNACNVLANLKNVWIDMIDGFMVEAKWFNDGEPPPNLEEYLENGISTAGAYMAFVHLFFLIGEGVTAQATGQLLKKPYPKLFSAAGRILRLWDDLGTAKEEEERGDFASSIHLLMKEKRIWTEEEGRKRVLREINNLWKDLNEELILSKNGMPLSIIKVALNMARTAQVVYNHEEHTYFSSVDNYVEALFFTPL